jgi:perosamine synthetase
MRIPSNVRDVPFAKPDFDDAESGAVAEVLASGWVSQGPRVARFEELFARRVGARCGVATTSCTTALHLALVIAGVGPGDEVICPSYTFIATANAVLYAGATPIFADVRDDTWNIDPADTVRRVTPRTKAVVLVHQVGLAADVDAFAPLKARGIVLIEDAACAIGSTYKGRPVGSAGNVACWSFHPRKTISMGEGGMLTTDDAAAAEHARRLRSFAASVSDHVRHQANGVVFEEYRELGFNYRMTDLQAAIGIEQLAKLDRLLARRAAIARRYDEAFARIPGIQVPANPPHAPHAYQSYGIRLLPGLNVDRDAALRALVERGISSRRGIPPIHLEPLYLNRFGRVSLPVTEELGARSIFLPIFGTLADDDQTRVIDAVTAILTRAS